MFFDKPVVCGEAGVVSVPAAIGKKVEGLGLTVTFHVSVARQGTSGADLTFATHLAADP